MVDIKEAIERKRKAYKKRSRCVNVRIKGEDGGHITKPMTTCKCVENKGIR